ncbi:MAG: hypothetical protein IPL99_08440 [Candidatus Competibacteraceae bacterium]|nr:hypothetical protein [Candidatus Competibacteraceae bacterium]
MDNPHHSPPLRPLERAAAALGKRWVLALERFGPRPLNRIEFDPLGILPPRPFPPPASRSGAVQALCARHRTLPY